MPSGMRHPYLARNRRTNIITAIGVILALAFVCAVFFVWVPNQ